jgi:hypothetical protein
LERNDLEEEGGGDRLLLGDMVVVGGEFAGFGRRR